jgi:hypothetical protein
VRLLKLQEIGEVNEAFENDSQQMDTDNKFSLYNGDSTATAADKKRNVVFILINH